MLLKQSTIQNADQVSKNRVKQLMIVPGLYDKLEKVLLKFLGCELIYVRGKN